MLIFKIDNKRIKLSSPDRRSVSNKEVLNFCPLPSRAGRDVVYRCPH